MKTPTKATLVAIVAGLVGFVLAWLVIEWMLETLPILVKVLLAVSVALVLAAAGYIQYTRLSAR